jgi:hypothetical protein
MDLVCHHVLQALIIDDTLVDESIKHLSSPAIDHLRLCEARKAHLDEFVTNLVNIRALEGCSIAGLVVSARRSKETDHHLKEVSHGHATWNAVWINDNVWDHATI